MIAIILWVTVTSAPVFYLLKKFKLLRLSKEIEVLGTDLTEMGGVPQWLYDEIKVGYSSYIKREIPLEYSLQKQSIEKMARPETPDEYFQF